MKRQILYSLFVLALMSCAAPSKLEEARAIEPKGTEFQKTLHQEYIKQAETEIELEAIADAEFYADRAITAGLGYRVEPYYVGEDGLPSETAPIFRKAKGRLNNALNGGARKQTPYRAARAQAAYDCWWEEVVDNNGLTQRAQVCRNKFRKNIGEIETILDGQEEQ